MRDYSTIFRSVKSSEYVYIRGLQLQHFCYPTSSAAHDGIPTRWSGWYPYPIVVRMEPVPDGPDPYLKLLPDLAIHYNINGKK